MGKKCQNAAAAHARQARWLAPCSSDDLVDSSTHVDATPIVVDVDSSSECGYTGGVDVDSEDSDDEYDEGGQMTSEWELSDSDSLNELEGDELEENLQMLQAEAEAEVARLEKPSAFEQILKPVTSTYWKRAEENRSLGYNGLSKRTKERRAQQARTAEKRREEAKNS